MRSSRSSSRTSTTRRWKGCAWFRCWGGFFCLLYYGWGFVCGVEIPKCYIFFLACLFLKGGQAERGETSGSEAICSLLGRVHLSLLSHYVVYSPPTSTTACPGDGGTSPVSHTFASVPSRNTISPPFVMIPPASPCSNQFFPHSCPLIATPCT